MGASWEGGGAHRGCPAALGSCPAAAAGSPPPSGSSPLETSHQPPSCPNQLYMHAIRNMNSAFSNGRLTAQPSITSTGGSSSKAGPAAAAAGGPQAGGTQAGAPGLHKLGLAGRPDGLLYVPATYRPGVPAPFILTLHGAGADGHGATWGEEGAGGLGKEGRASA